MLSTAPRCPDCKSTRIRLAGYRDEAKTIRRFKCLNDDCPRTTFTEQTAEGGTAKIIERERILTLTREKAELERHLAHDSQTAKILAELRGRFETQPAWLVPTNPKRMEAVATAFLSDCHFDEVVDPKQIRNINRYNRAIAERRLRTFFEKTIRLSRDYCSGADINKVVVPLGGDLVSGNIHEELRETNEGPIIETCLHWAQQIATGLTTLADNFEHIHVPCVVGNHGRIDRKPRSKNRVYDNFDYLIYRILADKLAGNKRITFDVSDSADVAWKVYNTRYHMTHGDQFRGGDGITGLAMPVARGNMRKSRREMSLGEGYDCLLIGHWHTYQDYGNVVVNGSLKGYDEYAFDNNFGFEPPQQAFFLTDPKHGRSLRGPIFVDDTTESTKR